MTSKNPTAAPVPTPTVQVNRTETVVITDDVRNALQRYLNSSLASLPPGFRLSKSDALRVLLKAGLVAWDAGILDDLVHERPCSL